MNALGVELVASECCAVLLKSGSWNKLPLENMLRVCLGNSKLDQINEESRNQVIVSGNRLTHLQCSNLFDIVLFLFSSVRLGCLQESHF